MAANLERYISLFYKLLPPGKAWAKSHLSNLYKLIASYIPELIRVEIAAKSLLKESNPMTATESLPDWERALGLPDHCTKNLKLSINQRRSIVTQRFVAGGGSTLSYYEFIVSLFGYPGVTARDYKPFRSGKSQSGDQISNGAWRFYFKITSNNVLINNFQSGKSQSGDQIRTFGDPALECIIKRNKAAHTKVLFSYGDNQ